LGEEYKSAWALGTYLPEKLERRGRLVRIRFEKYTFLSPTFTRLFFPVFNSVDKKKKRKKEILEGHLPLPPFPIPSYVYARLPI